MGRQWKLLLIHRLAEERKVDAGCAYPGWPS
jgi:hypothetical protein